MNKVIRHGAFETNSSSTHTLCLCTDGELRPWGSTGLISIDPGEFGWEDEEYDGFYGKASYALTHALNYWVEEVKVERLETLRRVIESFTGCEVDFLPGEGYWEDGYIDHQSYDDAEHYGRDADVGAPIWESDDHLRHFLFHPGSSITTGNDNG